MLTDTYGTAFAGHSRRSRRTSVLGRSSVPLVVCVSPDREVRENLVRRLDDLGTVLMCADIGELRAMLAPGTSSRPVREPSETIRFGDLVVDSIQHQVAWRGRALELT